MKHLISLVLLFFIISASAQSRKPARMAPIMAKGYYINSRNDTVKGEVQTNPADPVSLYKVFKFKGLRGGKPRAYDARRAKAYGYDDKHFSVIDYNDQKLFAERLVAGRLEFFEYQYHGKVDGYAGIESAFFIKDNGAEGDDANLQELKKISNLFYKRSLKPYMKDQVMLWKDLDKFDFDRDNVIAAIKEFNQFYPADAYKKP